MLQGRLIYGLAACALAAGSSIAATTLVSVDAASRGDSTHGKVLYQGCQAWLANPSALVPGTKMYFKVDDAQARADIIAYLRELR